MAKIVENPDAYDIYVVSDNYQLDPEEQTCIKIDPKNPLAAISWVLRENLSDRMKLELVRDIINHEESLKF